MYSAFASIAAMLEENAPFEILSIVGKTGELGAKDYLAIVSAPKAI
jgi:hypothetical protein